MKWRHLTSAALLAAALTQVVAAQEQQPDPLFKLGEQSRTQILLLIDSAKSAGLPWQALRMKAIEGANKKFDGKAVLKVVREYAANLSRSRSLLGPLANDEQIESAAALLIAGVRSEDVAQFRVTSRTRSPSNAMVILTGLITQPNGVPRDEATAAIIKLWKDGAAEADFEALWHAVDGDILSGISPRAAFQSRIRSLPPPRPIRPPAENE